MSTESRLLLENVIVESIDESFSYGTKQPAAGYYKKDNALHTVVYNVNSFKGTFKIQGTLSLYPGDNDWIDIADSEIGGDSSYFLNETIDTFSFVGNFVWIRAAYNLIDGTIVEIRYNH